MTVSRKIPAKWGQTATYTAPAEPWDGQLTKVDPSTDIFDPEANLPAEHANFALKQAEDNAITAAQLMLTSSEWNTYGPISGTLIDVCFARSASQGWLTVEDNSGTYNAYYYEGSFASSNPGPATYRANFAGGTAPQKIWDFGNGSFIVLEANGNFRRITSGGLTSPSGVAGSTWRSVATHQYFGGANALAVSDAGAGSLFFKTTNSGASWSSVSTPSSVTSYHSTWSSATGDGFAMFSPTDGNKSQTLAWDGTTLTQITVATGLVAVAYDDENDCFYSAVWDGGDTQIYKLKHGAGWAVTNVGSVANARVSDMACVGGIVVVNITVAPSSWALQSDTSTLPRVIYAAARAGEWIWTPVSCSVIPTAKAPLLRAGYTGFAAFTDALLAKSPSIGVVSPF